MRETYFGCLLTTKKEKKICLTIMMMQKCLWKLHSAKRRFNEFKSENFNRTQIWGAVKVQSNSQVVLGTATNGATPEAYYLKKKFPIRVSYLIIGIFTCCQLYCKDK